MLVNEEPFEEAIDVDFKSAHGYMMIGDVWINHQNEEPTLTDVTGKLTLSFKDKGITMEWTGPEGGEKTSRFRFNKLMNLV